MEPMNAFEQQLARVAGEVAGPERPVDAMDVMRLAKADPVHRWSVTARWFRDGTGRPTERGFSVFSALKFVAAATIVALFGGFLLSGALITQQGDGVVPGAVTASASPLATTEAGAFSGAGSLAEARAAHTATLLLDGRVLVVGGYETHMPSSTSVASAEVWDPATATFSPAGSLAIARDGHTATLLPDGRVVVIGGYGFGVAAHPIEVWDPATGSFSREGVLTEIRMAHTATLLPDGRILVIGGNRQIASAELWDPATGSFSPAGSLIENRMAHTATLLPDGRVLVIGGMDMDSDGGAFATAEMWDPATESFSPAGSLSEARSGHTATLLPDGRVLIVGQTVRDASRAEIWDPVTGDFEPTGSYAWVRQGGHSATLLPDGRVLVTGGTGVLSPAEIWDPATGSFGPAGSMTGTGWSHTATLLPDGRVLVIGADPAAEVWEFNDS